MKSGIDRQNLPTTVTGTQDFTVSGLGTPDAAVVVCCEAGSSNPANDGMLAIGFYDGTNVRSSSSRTDNGGAKTDTHRSQDDGSYRVQGGAQTNHTEYSISAASDKITLTCDLADNATSRHATALLLSGISAKVLTFTPSATENGTQESASIGFEPKLILFSCISNATVDQANLNNGQLSFGYCADDPGLSQACMSWGSRDNFTTSNAQQQFRDDRCIARVYSTTSTEWSGEITTMGADTFTMTTRQAGTPGVVMCLVLGGAGFEWDDGIVTTRTSNGTTDVTTSVEAETILMLSSFMSGTTRQTAAECDSGMCIGLSDGTNDYSHNMCEEDNTSTHACRSASSTTAIIDVDSVSGGTYTDELTADISAVTASDFTINYTATNATAARKGFWIAFGKEAAAGVVPIADKYRRIIQG